MVFLRSLIAAAILTQTALALTPVGHTPSGAPMYEAPFGSRVLQVGRDMKVFAPNGTVIHTFANVVPQSSTPAPTRRQALSDAAASVQLTNTSDLLESLNTTIVVPSPPTTFNSQLMWVAGSIKIPGNDGVPFASLRAVLQYGATAIQGGPFWTIAAQLELLPDGGLLQISRPGFDPTVSAGTSISTSIVHTDEGDALFWYTAAFDNIPGSSNIEVGFQMPASVAVVGMEEEGVFQSSEYPAEPLTFGNTSLKLTSGFPDIEWDTSSDSGSGAYVTVDKDGSEDAEITIHF
ncbi:hypothetical protein R3P38DRAFT_3376876 [Favolaschia claudopus]|uniref:Uncharacterized protein n=1 Tax=Favolaschia claudopus TaxID=2862362 RepID=A0AAV9ZEB0_9AGAR